MNQYKNFIGNKSNSLHVYIRKTIGDLKEKLTSVKQQMDEENEEMKTNLERQMKSLESRLQQLEFRESHPAEFNLDSTCFVSSLTGEGLEKVKEEISKIIPHLPKNVY